MVDHFSAYIYQKRGFYYFSRLVRKQLQHRHSKQRIVLAFNTKSRAKALNYAQVTCQRLDERWLPMRLDAMGFNNVLANDDRILPSPDLSESMQLYLQLRGTGKAKTLLMTLCESPRVTESVLTLYLHHLATQVSASLITAV